MPAWSPPTTAAINAVSGYSGGGRTMIEAYERGTAPAFELYGLGLAHKHVPELMRYARLARRPIFVPSVGNFRQGMLVSIPLHLDALPGASPRGPRADARVPPSGSGCVSVVAQAGQRLGGRIDALALNGTDQLELCVFGSDELRQAVLVARLDNLGKAPPAPRQNIALMLGVEL